MKLLAKFVASFGVVALLSGCAVVQQAGAAAVIGGTRLTNEQVATELDAIIVALGDAQSQLTRSELNRQIVSSFIFSNLVEQVAAELGVKVTDSEIAARRAELAGQAGGEAALAKVAAQSGFSPANIDRTIRMSTLFARITARLSATGSADDSAAQTEAYQRLMAAAMADNVQVADRYGSFDVNTLQLSDLVNDTSVTAAELAGSATQ